MTERQHFEYFAKAEAGAVGFDVYRTVTNETVYDEAFKHLRGSYGIDVLPYEIGAGTLTLATNQETGSALIKSGVAGLGAQAIEGIAEKVSGAFTYDMQNPMLSATNKFSVSINAVRGGNRVIALRMTTDARHAQHRQIFTETFDTATGVPLSWPPFRALLPVALLADPSLADKIRRTGKRAPIRVPLGPIILSNTIEPEE